MPGSEAKCVQQWFKTLEVSLHHRDVLIRESHRWPQYRLIAEDLRKIGTLPK